MQFGLKDRVQIVGGSAGTVRGIPVTGAARRVYDVELDSGTWKFIPEEYLAAVPLTQAERSDVMRQAIERVAEGFRASGWTVEVHHPAQPDRRIRSLWDPTELAAMARERDLALAMARGNQA